jgi:phosphonate transport system ATP-binding protein
MRPDECAFIHQHHPLMPQLSVFHNVYMGGLNCHTTLSNLLNLVKPQKKMIAEVLPVIRSIGMEEKMFVRVEQLTREQKQRVAIGQAIYRNSPILLADEPTASLDPLCVDSILKLIINTDKTVIMVLHSVELTLKFAQRIIGICAGTIQFDLPIDQVTSDNITDLYISDGLP